MELCEMCGAPMTYTSDAYVELFGNLPPGPVLCDACYCAYKRKLHANMPKEPTYDET